MGSYVFETPLLVIVGSLAVYSYVTKMTSAVQVNV